MNAMSDTSQESTTCGILRLVELQSYNFLNEAPRLDLAAPFPADAVLVVASNMERNAANKHFVQRLAQEQGKSILSFSVAIDNNDNIPIDEEDSTFILSA